MHGTCWPLISFNGVVFDVFYFSLNVIDFLFMHLLINHNFSFASYKRTNYVGKFFSYVKHCSFFGGTLQVSRDYHHWSSVGLQRTFTFLFTWLEGFKIHPNMDKNNLEKQPTLSW